MRTAIIVNSTNVDDIINHLPIEGANFTNGTYAPPADCILETTLAGFEFVNSTNNLPMVVAINSDESMRALGKTDFESQQERAKKITDPLTKNFPDRRLIIIFYDEKTPTNLYHMLSKQGLTKTLHKWGYGTDPKAPKIEGAEYFVNVYAFPLPNDTKPVCYYDTDLPTEPQKIEVVDLRDKLKDSKSPQMTKEKNVLVKEGAVSTSFFGMNFNDCFNEHDVTTDSFRKISTVANPSSLALFDLVYVLSGRGTVLGNDADRLERECDLGDDLERMREGIRIAMIVNALKAGKEVKDLAPEDYVTPIFYNGRAIHNRDLEKALDLGILHYPKSLFIIRSIFPENTIGQVNSFTNYLREHPHQYVAVVSSAYHLLRVAKTIGADSPQAEKFDDVAPNPLKNLKLFLFGVHKKEMRKGVFIDIRAEWNAIKNYSTGKAGFPASISKNISRNIFFCDQDVITHQQINASLFWKNRAPSKCKVLNTKRTLKIC